MAKLIVQRRQKQAQYYTEDLGNGITMDMILIRGGTFFMGSPETELKRTEYEEPQHKVVDIKVFRGGSFGFNPDYSRSALRLNGNAGGNINNRLGFRVVCVLQRTGKN